MGKVKLASKENLITHGISGSFDLKFHEDRLRNTPSLILPLEEELTLLNQLTEFELGRFLLENKGINGYWTAYWVVHGPQKKFDHPLEEWLIHKTPGFKASQERFKIFQKEIQSRLHSNMKLASIPCGLMDDLLGLDYEGKENIELIGIDLDQESLDLGKINAQKYSPKANVSFYRRDVWSMGALEEYDLITSNGLNFYEADEEKIVDLYKTFYQALCPNGILVTSFLTPPPGSPAPSPWKNFNPQDAIKQKALSIDILQAKWQAHRTEAQTRQQLEAAGLKVIDVINDSQNIFPTVIAQK